jgi:hypothetical protein
LNSSWSRDTKWRQGSILDEACANALQLLVSDRTIYIAITHDCDIAHENLEIEPEIEFVRATRIDRIDGNFSNAKNSRTLHALRANNT